MRCKEFNRRLNELNGRARGPVLGLTMEVHRAHCPRCAEVWRAEQLLRAWAVPAPPPTLLERICALLDEIAAGTVVPFPVRRTILITCLVLAGAAAAAAATSFVLEQMDVFGGADRGVATAAVVEGPVAGAERSESIGVAEQAEPPEPTQQPEPTETAFENSNANANAIESAVAANDTEVSVSIEPEESSGADAPSASAVSFNRLTIVLAPVNESAPDVVLETPDLGGANLLELSTIPVARPVVADATPPEQAPVVSPRFEAAFLDAAVPVVAAVPEVPEVPAAVAGSLDSGAQIDAHLEAARFDQAIELGRSYVAQISAQFGETSTELAEAHLLLGTVHRSREDYVAAEGQIRAAIDILETIELNSRDDSFDPRPIFDAVLLLADTYEMAGEHTLAIAQFTKARNISRTAWGLRNPEQLDVLQRLSGAYLAAGAVGEAKERQLELSRLSLQIFGDDSLEAVAAHYRYARWLREHGESGPRRDREISLAYGDARTIISRHYEDGDPAQAVRLLYTHASEIMTGGFAWGTGATDDSLRALWRARQLYHDKVVDEPLLLAGIGRLLGDWALLAGAPLYAARNYSDAWLALGSQPNPEELRAEWFPPLARIYAAPADARLMSADPDAPYGYVEMEFSLDVFGRAGYIDVIRSDPPGLLDATAARQLRGTLFRPTIVDGKTVVSRETVRWHYRYDPAILTTGGE